MPISMPMNRIQGDAKTGISSLSLMRKVSVNYRTTWLLHNKIMQAMSEREKSYILHVKVQLDDAFPGGKHNNSKPSRGSENKVPIVAAVSLDEAGLPIQMKEAKVETFSFAAIADWAQVALA
jgi:hypothetical protein